MKDDLARNALLGEKTADTITKTAGKILTKHEQIQRLAMYWMVLKGVLLVLIVGGLLYGGFQFAAAVKNVATEAVVSEVKDTAKEKYDEVKGKVTEKAEGKSLFGSLSSVADNVNATFNKLAAERLIEKGYSPDAPRYCAVNPSTEQLKTCILFSDNELSTTEYEWIQTAWKGTCEEVHKKAITMLTTAGKLTYNDQRALISDCDKIKAQNSNEKLEQMKRRMMHGDSNV